MSGRGDSGKRGHGKDGRPYKEGNTREDGSYKAGFMRPPEHGKFRTGDGRKRGKREKGSKNLDTIWDRHLNQRMTLNGETRVGTAWVVYAIIRRAISRSDRAAEIALAAAARLDRRNERPATGSEDEIIAAYIAQCLADLGIKTSDDEPDNDSGGGPDEPGKRDAD